MNQPNYLPWYGFMGMMSQADVFLVMDEIQYEKEEWQNRNRITSSNPKRWEWITVPVSASSKSKISEVSSVGAWRKQHISQIHHAYSRAAYYECVSGDIYSAIWGSTNSLLDIDMRSTKTLMEVLDFKPDIKYMSDLGCTSKNQQLVQDLAGSVGADQIIVPKNALKYWDLSKKTSQDLLIHEFPDISYKHLNIFVPRLSVIDMLFNLGPKTSRNLIMDYEKYAITEVIHGTG